MTIRSTAKVSVALVSTALILTACSTGGSGGEPTGGTSSSTGDAAADVAATIVVAVEPVSIDPCDSQDAANAIVLRGNVTESLTRIDPETGEVTPLLALSWEQKDDTTWTFHLREGVTFQDGTPFDAEAAVAAIARVTDPELNCQNLDQFPYALQATAVDATTLDVTSAEPDSILPLRLSWADISAPSTPADAKTLEPVGTGPYAFSARVQGESVTLERYDGYWGDAPQVTSVKYVYRAEPAVRAAMAKTGEASIAVPISVQDASDDDRTREYRDNRVFFLRTSTDRAPFDDIRVRQAAQLAIDKESIVGTLMERSGVPTDQMVASSVNGFVPDYVGPKFDPDEAKALLAEAAADGVDVTAPFDLVTRPDLFPGSDEVIQAIYQNLKDVGFSVDILSLDTDAWLTLLRAPFPPDQKANIIGISHDNVSGDSSFTFPKYIGGDGANSTIRSPEIDELLVQAESATGDERAELYQEAARFEYESVGAIIPVALQSKLMMLAAGVEYTPNPLSGVELRVSDVRITN